MALACGSAVAPGSSHYLFRKPSLGQREPPRPGRAYRLFTCPGATAGDLARPLRTARPPAELGWWKAELHLAGATTAIGQAEPGAGQAVGSELAGRSVRQDRR